MGFFRRLFTLSFSKKPKKKANCKGNKAGKAGSLTSSSTNNFTTSTPHEQDAVVNRLLRSSSAHFSVLSETDYHSLPPLPHPINNALRAPSVMTNSTQMTNFSTYNVTVHSRTIHSRTEFPNANGSTTAISTPATSPTRKRSIPPLTPGDKCRLEKLRQDASVLSLLNIYDDSGQPNPEAFINTPAPRKSRSTTTSFRVLLGEDPNPTSSSDSNTNVEESDLSWADRCIRTGRKNSTSSTSTASYSGIAASLFRAELSLDQLHVDEFHAETSASSNDTEAAFDSLNVELGTAEDGSLTIQPKTSGLTNRASQFFKFLTDSEAVKTAEKTALPSLCAYPSSTVPFYLQSHPHTPRGPRSISTGPVTAGGSTTISIREGPKESHVQLSPAPRRHQYPPPLPPIPPEFQLKPSRSKPLPLGHRAPASEPLDVKGMAVPRNVSNRTPSVASSVHPQIEMSQDTKTDIDLYTPIPRRLIGEDKRDVHYNIRENPPNAPARPVRGQTRSYFYGKSTRNKGESSSQVLLSKSAVNQPIAVPLQIEKAAFVPTGTLVITPVNPANFPPSHLQTPSRPSPASSSELSPECRRIMDAVRAQALVPKVGVTRRPWQSWNNALDGP